MDDLHQDSHAQTGLESKHFALCSEHFESSYFSRSVLIGTPVDLKTFYLEEGSVPPIYTKTKIHWTLITQEMREDLQIDFFPKNNLWMFLWDPTEKRQYPKSHPPPPKEKLISFRTGQAYSRYAFDLPR